MEGLLQFFQQSGGVFAVHLGVMELERDGKRGLQPAFAIAAPGHEGVVEDAAVLIDDAVEFCARDCRCADYHSVFVQDVLTGPADGLCQTQVIGIKRLQVVAEGNVAETESALDVIRYHIDGHAVVFVQLPLLGQHVKLLNLRCSTADAPAQQHVEFHAPFPAHLTQPGHIERLRECHHRHGRLRPQFEGDGSIVVLGIDFLFHHSITKLRG